MANKAAKVTAIETAAKAVEKVAGILEAVEQGGDPVKAAKEIAKASDEVEKVTKKVKTESTPVAKVAKLPWQLPAQEPFTFDPDKPNPYAAIEGKAVFKQDRNRTSTYISKDKLSEVGEMVTLDEFGRMDHGVVVMNMALKPSETYTSDLPHGRGVFEYDGDDDFGHPFHRFGHINGTDVLRRGKDAKTEKVDYKCYRFILNNRPVAAILDSKSKLWIGDRGAYSLPWDIHSEDIPLDEPVIIVMKNSVAVDCNFYSQSVLVNVQATECRIHETILASYELDDDVNVRLSWNGRRQSSFRQSKRERDEFKGSDFIFTRVENSILHPGLYFRSQVKDSSITMTGQATVRSSTITESTLSASGRLFINDTRMDGTRITSKGSLLLQMPSLNDHALTIDGLYARNKFAITKIDVVGNGRNEYYQLVRVSPTEMQFSIGYGESTKINLGTDEWKIRLDVRDWLKTNDVPRANETKGTPDAPYSPIKESIHNFVIDSIISRIKAINLLDDAIEVAHDIERKDMSHHFNNRF